MRFVRARRDNECFYAIVEGNKLYPLTKEPYEEIVKDGRCFDIGEAALLPPCEPTKLVCIGKNYWAHAEEMKEGHPVEPLLFLKPTTCVVGDGDDVVYPQISNRVDYEGELGAVIGKRCSKADAKDAYGYIFGYLCANDVTARDIQKSESQFTRGKGFDTFCPLGPWIETDVDPNDLAISTKVNGKTRQSSNTALMTHKLDELIAYISAVMTLLPGDVILTGTPEGIGPMNRGDVVEVEIEGIGVLRNKLV